MTEALGRSQVLEYLIDLSINNKIYLLSFERKNDIEHINEVKKITDKHSINWQYLIYSNKYGVISTIVQIIKAIYYGSSCIRKNKINIIHARSMIPATMGLILKKIHNIKLLFDIRGFAIDEKVDNQRLKKDSLLFSLLKKLDNTLYKQADHIVTLTHAAKDILQNNLLIPKNKITVIPTCANKNIFPLLGKTERASIRKKLGFTDATKILIHSGTTTNRYDFDLEVKVFKKLYYLNPNIKFLIVNQGEIEYITNVFKNNSIDSSAYFIISSTFDDMYKYLNIADLAIFFIPPTFAKLAMAPTKFAENVACHLPSVTNNGVGDMSFYMEKYDVGYLLNLDDLTQNMDDAIKKVLPYLNQEKINGEVYDNLFKLNFDKKIAVQKYQAIYDSL